MQETPNNQQEMTTDEELRKNSEHGEVLPNKRSQNLQNETLVRNMLINYDAKIPDMQPQIDSDNLGQLVID